MEADLDALRAKVLAALNGCVMAVEPMALEACCAKIAALDLTAIDRTRLAEPRAVTPPQQGTAIIPVHGVLTPHGTGLPMLDALFGIAPIDALSAEFRAAQGDPHVSDILFDVHSPGGDVSGLLDFADAVFAARDGKPMAAVANDLAASGAYVIASAAGPITASRTAVTGSIGAAMVRIDATGLDAQLGVKHEVFASGAKKTRGNPHVATTDAERADIQAEVDRMGRTIEAMVATHRGSDPKTIRGLEAATFRGEQAKKNGLVDQIGTFSDALATLQARTASERETHMAAETKTPEPEKPKADILDFAVEGERIRSQAQSQERARAKAIHALCAEAKLPGLAGAYIEQGLGLEDVTARLGAASEITASCTIMKLPALAESMIARGLSPGQAKAELCDALVAAGGPDITSRQAPAVPEAPTTIDVTAVYATYNAHFASAKATRLAAELRHAAGH